MSVITDKLCALALASLLLFGGEALAQIGPSGTGYSINSSAPIGPASSTSIGPFGKILPVAATPPPATYKGPGDIVSGASAWWGLRAYNAAYATGSNPAADICDVATGATCTTINILSNGNFDVATAQASSSCATSCNVSKLYDQTKGNACGGSSCDLVQATNANRPVLVFNCIGSLPCLQATTAAQQLTSTNSITPATGIVSLSTVANRAVFTGTTNILVRENAGANNRIRTAGSNLWQVGSSLNVAANDAAWHTSNSVVNGASSVANVDGTEATGTVTGDTAAGAPRILVGAASETIDQTEAGFWDNATFTGTQRTNLCHNQFTYWGTSTSC